MARSVAVIGTGYVGLIQAVGLADFGNKVVGVDLRTEIVEQLNSGQPTIFEHGLPEYLQRNIDSGRLSFTTDPGPAISAADVVFIAVGTPQDESGAADLSQVEAVVDTIREHATGQTAVVTKSTVPVGTNRWVAQRLGNTSGNRSTFVVASNPEFLREGRAVQDFFHPDRVIVGIDQSNPDAGAFARDALEELYRPLYLVSTPFVWTDLETAELIKYASNAFLATKIGFINQMANLAEAVGADIHTVAKSMGMDGRISPKFLHPGPGYGGSCFPKDTHAVVAMGQSADTPMTLLQAVIDSNKAQKSRVVDKIAGIVGGDLSGRIVAILGLAFKAETDDVRESPAITVVSGLLESGATVKTHDPKAMDTFGEMFGDRVTYHSSSMECVGRADCVVILTEWNEYRNLDLKQIAKVVNHRNILDTRNVLDPEDALAAGFVYEGTGRARREPTA